jgi:hypothetical protein
MPDGSRDRLLALVSTAQLVTGILGLAIALKRRHAYDFLMLHGRRDKVARDALTMGTALSAPAGMLGAQGVAAARLLRTSSDPARLVLGILGAAMTGGYLGESLVRRRLHPSNWDGVESPVVVAGLGLSAAMAVIAFAGRRRP